MTHTHTHTHNNTLYNFLKISLVSCLIISAGIGHALEGAKVGNDDATRSVHVNINCPSAPDIHETIGPGKNLEMGCLFGNPSRVTITSSTACRGDFSSCTSSNSKTYTSFISTSAGGDCYLNSWYVSAASTLPTISSGPNCVLFKDALYRRK